MSRSMEEELVRLSIVLPGGTQIYRYPEIPVVEGTIGLYQVGLPTDQAESKSSRIVS